MSESAAAVVITTVLSILVIVDIVGNSVVCAIIKRNRDMRYVETKIIIISASSYTPIVIPTVSLIKMIVVLKAEEK